ncbi:MAG TPA: alpha/beta hydrolase [Anaerolineae bacterium]|jgi:alpha-beta hydrolase superfamily lysophospholipase
MQHIEDTFTSSDGTKLYTQQWGPENAPRAVIVVVHGFGEHSGRYMNLVNYFVPRGYRIYSYDLRGHGRSGGARGHVMSWTAYRQDLTLLKQRVLAVSGNLPVFLYGHSFGGLMVLDYALHEPEGFHGLIASAPAIGKVGISPILLTLSRVMSRVYPTFTIQTGLDATSISRDPAVVAAYINDPMVHSFASARTGTEMAKTQDYVLKNASELKMPLLMVQGSADRLVPPQDGRTFFERVPYGDKRYISYEGSYHEVHNDLDQLKAFTDIELWLEEHLH